MKSDVSKPEKASTKRNNQQDLPDFNTLVKMASEDPEGLEKLRREMAENLINQAPKDTQRKLRGLQFKIDMERRRAKNLRLSSFQERTADPKSCGASGAVQGLSSGQG